MSKTVAAEIVEVLEQAGVKNCYGIVGDTLNLIATEIHKSSIDWVHVRHEEVGGFAAGAEAHITGRLTACAGSCGPGGLHFINGLYESHRNRSPVILIASQIITSQLGTEYPQEVDFKSIYKSCTVFCEQIQSAEQARRITAMACQAAIAKRGVAVLIVPNDISQAKVKHSLPYSVHFPKPITRPSDEELTQIVAKINQGKNIGIYVGSAAEGAHDVLIALANVLKAPIAHSSRAKDFIEYDNPYLIGMTGMLGNKSALHMMGHCDTLLLLGSDFAWANFYPNKATIIQVDLDGSHLGRRHPVTLGVVGDVKSTIEALLPLLTPKQDTHFLTTCLALYQKVLEEFAHDERHQKGDLIHPQYLVHLLSKHADEDALFTADGGSAFAWYLRHLRMNGKRRSLSTMLHGTMANAMPQALGFQKACPGRQVISISGDGGLTMLLGDLLTAVQENLPIKVAVLNNHSLNFVALEQKVEGLLDVYVDLKNPDFAELAKVIGFYGRKVTKAEDLDAAVQEFLTYDGPALLDVHTSPTELIMPPKVTTEEIYKTTQYGAKAVLSGRIKDVKDLLVNNFIK